MEAPSRAALTGHEERLDWASTSQSEILIDMAKNERTYQ
ncbi:hypothetical protein AVEN_60165-1, partial [Araneus ventricosus]